ncbi:MAG: putative motility protein [Oscillospiraceae bacterium]|jgi:hypothetical protein|nr:putative motility protein [Oscillospiraceae bacterium]
MDIAAMSMQMSMAQVQEAANISVMRKAMDMQETQMANLLQNLEAAAPAVHTGHKLNIVV